MRELQKEALEASQAIKRHGRESMNLRVAMQRAEETAGKLQDALEEDRIEEGRLEALKEHLKEAEEELRTHQGSFEEGILSKDKVNESMKLAREQRAAIDVRIDEATTKLKKAEGRALTCSKQRQQDLQQKNTAINAVSDAKDRFAHAERKRESQLKVVKEHTAEAEKISARVPVPPGESADALDKKLIKLHKDLETGLAR